MDVYAHLKLFIEILAFKVMLTCGGLWRTKSCGQTFVNRISTFTPSTMRRPSKNEECVSQKSRQSPGMEAAVAQGFLDPRTMRNISLCLYTTPFMTFCYND